MSIFGSINSPVAGKSDRRWREFARVSLQVVAQCGLFMALMGVVCTARADSIQVLAAFLKNTQSAQARFVQTVTTPPRPGRVARQKVSTGHFAFIRPEHFRFDYEKPYAQSIVADGHTLWVYDKDIAQVTSKPLNQALLNTPASIIAWAQDVSALEKVFTLQAENAEAGVEWVKLIPLQKDGPMQSLRIGLRATQVGVSLASLVMKDAFNQDSVLVFEDFVFNPKSLTLESFAFKPPVGVEVIKGE